MTSRQAGRRMQRASTRSRGSPRISSAPRPRRGNGKDVDRLRPKELRHLIQLVACGSIFVLLVAAKLLLPGKMDAFNARLSEALRKNMDVQAVFSAVGRAFDGSPDGALQDVYRSVFHPGSGDGTDALQTAEPVKLQDSPALDALRSYRRSPETSSAPAEDEAAEPPADEPAEPEPSDASNLAYVQYSKENLPDGVSMEQAVLGFEYCTPVNGVLSSAFGYREHPVEGEERFHYGVDLAADTGTDIACFADGTVTAVGESSSYGRYCIVVHDGGCSTLYAHCSRVVASSGAQVARGQKIAEVGETGMATGPHLHFELQKDGTYLNPIYYVAAS